MPATEWPTSNRNVGRLRVGMGGRLPSESAFTRNVTEQVRAQEELRRLAYQDQLTDLPNRRGFWEMTAGALESGQPLAVLLLDLDGFKHVNDTFGHGAGDELLREAATRLAQALGTDGTLARLGGDEFVALLAGASVSANAGITARRMLGSLSERAFLIRGHVLPILASAGVVVATAGEQTNPEKLLANADLALYAAKAAGGGVVRTFTARDRKEYEARRRLEDEVERAALNGEFELHYQPQVRLADGMLVGAEALIRWRHPEQGLLTPAAFLETLEASRHARVVGAWIIAEACRQASAMIHAPTTRACRLASSVSRNAAGVSNPCSGCRQRMRASAPTSMPSARRTCG